MKRRSVLAAAAATVVAASIVTAGTAAAPAEAAKASCSVPIVHKSAPQVSVWAWYPNMKTIVKQFNASHTNAQVCLTNAGQGADEYAKFSTAITAKKGAPDVVMLEDEVLPTFELQGGLVNLTKYGVNKVKSDFSAGAWKDVSSGKAVYAVPVDGGPMAMMYRKDVFAKYGITTPPTTWDEFKADAEKIKAAGGPPMADFGSNVPAFVTALMTQKSGTSPWKYDVAHKTKLGIDLDNAANKQVMDYWGDLVKNKLVGTQDQFNTDYISNVVNGKFATYLSAAWAPGYLQGVGAGAGADKGQWAVAPLPQWDASNPVSVNWGGSTFGVTTQSKHKKLAAQVAMGLYSSDAALKDGVSTNTIFPLSKDALDQDWFTSAANSFFSGQLANKEVYIPAENAYKGFTYSPFTTAYYAQLTKVITAVNSGKTTGSAGMTGLQKTMEKYAKSQGFKVS